MSPAPDGVTEQKVMIQQTQSNFGFSLAQSQVLVVTHHEHSYTGIRGLYRHACARALVSRGHADPFS